MIDEIEKQTEYRFNYERDSLLNYSYGGELPEIIQPSFFNQLFYETPFSYALQDETVLVFKAKANLVHLCGKIIDTRSGQGLPFATIYIPGVELGTTSDSLGNFSLKATLMKNQPVSVRYLGYHSQEMRAIAFQRGCLDIRLAADSKLLVHGIVIRDYIMPEIEQGMDYSSIHLNFEQMMRRSSTAQHDVLRTIQLLPGVYSTDESATGLHIRGFRPDQNLLTWEGVPLYDPGHFFGMISSVNPFNLNDVTVYKDAYHPKFDNRVGSLVELRLSDSIANGFSGSLGSNLTEGHALINIPIVKNHISISAGARHSIYGLFASPTFESFSKKVFQNTKVDEGQEEIAEGDLLANNQFDFEDFNVKVNIAPTSRLKASISWLKSANDFNYFTDEIFDRFETNDRVNYTSQAWQAKVSYVWHTDHRTQIGYSTSSSDNKFDFLLEDKEEDEVISSIAAFNMIEDEYVNLSHTWSLTPNWHLDLGYNRNIKSVAFAFEEILADEEDFEESHTRRETFHNVYSALQGSGNRWQVNVGIKNTRYHQGGGPYWSPRITAQYRLSDHLKVEVSGSRMYQFISQLEEFGEFDLNLNGNVWILRDPDEDSYIASNKFSAGLLYNRHGWLIDLSGYLGKSEGLSILTSSVQVESDPYDTGESKVKGVDLSVKKQWGPIVSWVNYAISENQYQFDELSDVSFASPNDQTHRLSWINRIQFGSFHFSATYQFKTGLPYTTTLGFEPSDPSEDTYEIIYGDINRLRLNDYHRLDLGLKYLQSENKPFFEVGIEIINLSNHLNRFNRSSFLDETEGDGIELFTFEKRLLGRTPMASFRLYW